METEKKVYPAEIIKAIHEVKSKVQYVQKDGKNTFHNYNYASEAALIAALHPAIQEAGLVIVPSGQELRPIDEHGNTHVVMSYTLTHISGAVWPDKLIAYGSGGDRSSKGTVGDKGCYKALTGVNKYFLRQLFQIETGTDPEKEGAKDKKDKTQKTGKQKAEEAGKDVKKVTEAQLKRLRAIAGDFEWDNGAVKSLIASYGYESSKDIENWQDYGEIIKKLQKGMDGKAKANAEGYCIFCNGKAKEPKKK
jgi:hypothetical protein